MTITITVEKDTIAKLKPLPSDQLQDDEKCMVKAGSTWAVHSYDEAPGQHIKVALLNGFLKFDQPRNTVFWFTPHISLEGNLPDNDPNDRPSSTPPAAPTIRVPGISQPVMLSQPVIGGGSFTWAEMTRNGTRVPEDRETTGQIVKIAKAMQEVRQRLGDRPIIITSAFRPAAVNRAVGGASQSRHVVGDAVDFYVNGLSTEEVYRQLDDWWGDRGGLAQRPGQFIHIDCRGWRSRWRY